MTFLFDFVLNCGDCMIVNLTRTRGNEWKVRFVHSLSTNISWIRGSNSGIRDQPHHRTRPTSTSNRSYTTHRISNPHPPILQLTAPSLRRPITTFLSAHTRLTFQFEPSPNGKVVIRDWAMIKISTPKLRPPEGSLPSRTFKMKIGELNPYKPC